MPGRSTPPAAALATTTSEQRKPKGPEPATSIMYRAIGGTIVARPGGTGSRFHLPILTATAHRPG